MKKKNTKSKVQLRRGITGGIATILNGVEADETAQRMHIFRTQATGQGSDYGEDCKKIRITSATKDNHQEEEMQKHIAGESAPLWLKPQNESSTKGRTTKNDRVGNR